MKSLEDSFKSTESMAESTIKAAAAVTRAAKALQKAAQVGNINAIKKSNEQLKEYQNTLELEVNNTVKTWKFSDEDIHEYMETHYSEEILKHSNDIDLSIFNQDGVLISYPSTIQVIPNDRAIRINGKKLSDLRPSKLVSDLKRNQNKGSKLNPARFLEGLLKAYKIVIGSDQSTGSWPVVKLQDIYEVFTSIPGSSRDYTKMDFTRDIYLVDASEARQTRDGSTVTFPASRGLATSRDIFPFVGEDGTPVTYYGIKFTRAR